MELVRDTISRLHLSDSVGFDGRPGAVGALSELKPHVSGTLGIVCHHEEIKPTPFVLFRDRARAKWYERHRPETTLLYRLVERHYPDFLAALADRDGHLQACVHAEFEAYLM